MLQQQHRRSSSQRSLSADVVGLCAVPHEEDGKTDNDIREELALMEDKRRIEEQRLTALLTGCGRGRGKSPEFEFAARTILATGCSARAAKDNLLLVGARLFLPPDKYDIFQHEVPGERWFHQQRKGLGYEAWVNSMIRVAKCDSILHWGFDETRYTYSPQSNLERTCHMNLLFDPTLAWTAPPHLTNGSFWRKECPCLL
jgi:hypothetical protein